MIGFVILAVGAIYLVLLAWATRAAYRWATRRGLSKTKCSLAAAGGFLVMYLPVFWDHIPTLVSYQYSCATEAGFWEYKTIEQWKKENPGVAETLVSQRVSPSGYQIEGKDKITTYVLNQRFVWVLKKSGPLPFNRWRWDDQVADSKTGEVLAKSIDFSTGDGSISGKDTLLQFWLHAGYCKDDGIYGGRLGRVAELAKNIGQRE